MQVDDCLDVETADLQEALGTLGEILAARGQDYDIVLIGGGRFCCLASSIGRLAISTSFRAMRLHALAERLSLGAPPRTRGEPKAWELLIGWGTAQMAGLTGGDHAALGAGVSRAGGEGSTAGV